MAEDRVESTPKPVKTNTLISTTELSIFQQVASNHKGVSIAVKAQEGQNYFTPVAPRDIGAGHYLYYPRRSVSSQETADEVIRARKISQQPLKVPKDELYIEITSPTDLGGFWSDVEKLRQESADSKK